MKCLTKLSVLQHIFVVSLMVLFSLCVARPSFGEIKIGVLAKRGANRVISQWGATGSYLTEKLGEQVVIIPIKFTLIDTMVKSGRIDFLLANSALFVEMQQRYQARAIATMINAKNHKPVGQFGGVIFTRTDSSVQELGDIRGKKFIVVQYSSFGGGQMALRLLIDNHFDLQKEKVTLMEAGTHDNVVHAIQKRVADVGTVRTDTLERMQAEGKIDMSAFRIIHQITDGFPFVHSTRLYPEWPMAALKHTPPELSAKLARALWKMKGDMPAAKAAYVIGWKEPADYSSVWECLKVIGDKNLPSIGPQTQFKRKDH